MDIVYVRAVIKGAMSLLSIWKFDYFFFSFCAIRIQRCLDIFCVCVFVSIKLFAPLTCMRKACAFFQRAYTAVCVSVLFLLISFPLFEFHLVVVVVVVIVRHHLFRRDCKCCALTNCGSVSIFTIDSEAYRVSFLLLLLLIF